MNTLIDYLTVFRSRLGTANIVLQRCNLVHQSNEMLSRKVKKVLDARVNLDLVLDKSTESVLMLLNDKGLVSKRQRKTGRYKGISLICDEGTWIVADTFGAPLTSLPVYQTDIWMSDTGLPSTIGNPTTDNANEIISLCYQLRLLTKTKNTLTSSGLTINSLRRFLREFDPRVENPFHLSCDSVFYLRQILEEDGVLLKELASALTTLDQPFRRDDVSQIFPELIRNVFVSMKAQHGHPENLRKAKKFLDTIQRTVKKRTSQSKGPGVLEHRVSPRLEWLVDLGYLSKNGLQRNAFEYVVTPALKKLLEDLDRFASSPDSTSSIVASQWRTNPVWSDIKSKVSCLTFIDALLTGYGLIRRRVGPSPIKEVVLLTCILTQDKVSYSSAKKMLLEYAESKKDVLLSGGRYKRSPENIYIPQSYFCNA